MPHQQYIIKQINVKINPKCRQNLANAHQNTISNQLTNEVVNIHITCFRTPSTPVQRWTWVGSIHGLGSVGLGGRIFEHVFRIQPHYSKLAKHF